MLNNKTKLVYRKLRRNLKLFRSIHFMKIRNLFLVVAITACNSPEPKSVKTLSIETDDEIKKEDSIESPALEQETNPFILANEFVVLSFKTKKNKQVFVCCDQDKRYLVYRFGSKAKVELQFPDRLDQSSFKKFDHSSYFRGGGVENLGMTLDYLSFTNHGYRYVIYKTYASESVGNENEVGIRIIQLKTNKETKIEGDFNSFEGGFPEEIMEMVNQSETLYD